MGAQINEKSLICGINENGNYFFIVNTLLIEGIDFLYQDKNNNLSLGKFIFSFSIHYESTD